MKDARISGNDYRWISFHREKLNYPKVRISFTAQARQTLITFSPVDLVRNGVRTTSVPIRPLATQIHILKSLIPG